MFGYIRPYKEELKLKDYNFYRGFYCALCTEMGKQLVLYIDVL